MLRCSQCCAATNRRSDHGRTRNWRRRRSTSPAKSTNAPSRLGLRSSRLSLGVFGLVTAEFLPGQPADADGARPRRHRRRRRAGGDGDRRRRRHRRADHGDHHQAHRPQAGDVDADALLIVSNLLAAFASALTMLLARPRRARHRLGGFWSMAAAMAMRLVPMRLMPRAMSIILTGVSRRHRLCRAGRRLCRRRLGLARGLPDRRPSSARWRCSCRCSPCRSCRRSGVRASAPCSSCWSARGCGLALLVVLLVALRAFRRLHLCPPVPREGARARHRDDLARAAGLWHRRLLRQSRRRLHGRAQPQGGRRPWRRC